MAVGVGEVLRRLNCDVIEREAPEVVQEVGRVRETILTGDILVRSDAVIDLRGDLVKLRFLLEERPHGRSAVDALPTFRNDVRVRLRIREHVVREQREVRMAEVVVLRLNEVCGSEVRVRTDRLLKVALHLGEEGRVAVVVRGKRRVHDRHRLAVLAVCGSVRPRRRAVDVVARTDRLQIRIESLDVVVLDREVVEVDRRRENLARQRLHDKLGHACEEVLNVFVRNPAQETVTNVAVGTRGHPCGEIARIVGFTEVESSRSTRVSEELIRLELHRRRIRRILRVDEEALVRLGEVRIEVPDDRLRRIPSSDERGRCKLPRRRIAIGDNVVEDAVLATNRILLRERHRNVIAVREIRRARHRVHQVEGFGLTAELSCGERRLAAAKRLRACCIVPFQRNGDAHRPLHVVVGLVDEEAVRDEGCRCIRDVRAVRHGVVEVGAERCRIAHVILVEVDLDPLANRPVELLVFLVEVGLLAVEIDAVFEVDVRDRPGIDDRRCRRVVGGARRRNLTHVDHLKLVRRDAEPNKLAAVLLAWEQTERRATERIRRRHLRDGRLQHPTRIRSTGARTNQEILSDVLILVEDAVTRRTVCNAAPH
jgi:hypothetical protein